MKIIVTGGAGFIGSNLIRLLITQYGYEVLNIDKLTYAGNLISLKDVSKNSLYSFKKADICDFKKILKLVFDYQPDAIMHLAAESHVDRSIDGPSDFIRTNIVGTYTLLQITKEYYESLSISRQKRFRFLHISTDEVFGSLGAEGYFTEQTPYMPRSPYSASKASSDHLVRAWGHTFNLPVLLTNCSNNYGPYQFPEKLIPLTILKAIKEESIPIYGKGENIRDWLFVADHCQALIKVMKNGEIGETYNIGGNNEIRNIDLVRTICKVLDRKLPLKKGSYEKLIRFVKDRPGHDMRYAIDAKKIKERLGFSPTYEFESGINLTIEWYLANPIWCSQVLQNKYNMERLGNK